MTHVPVFAHLVRAVEFSRLFVLELITTGNEKRVPLPLEGLVHICARGCIISRLELHIFPPPDVLPQVPNFLTRHGFEYVIIGAALDAVEDRRRLFHRTHHHYWQILQRCSLGINNTFTDDQCTRMCPPPQITNANYDDRHSPHQILDRHFRFDNTHRERAYVSLALPTRGSHRRATTISTPRGIWV